MVPILQLRKFRLREGRLLLQEPTVSHWLNKTPDFLTPLPIQGEGAARPKCVNSPQGVFEQDLGNFQSLVPSLLFCFM